MSDMKKIILCIFILVLLFIFFVAFNVFKKDIDENKAQNFCKFEKENYISTFLTASQITSLEENIIEYLKELEYTNEEIDVITFQNTTFSNDDIIYFYFLLDDEQETLYATSYDKNSNKISDDYIWCGDKISYDYQDDIIKATYLEVVNPEKYEEYLSNKKMKELNIEEIAPDATDDGEYDYSS
ncbi:MAG: hypothetical protein ACLTDD_08250 [Thomasclavelia spiroformis]|uniref:hypothetical protein n=1 Tax=Thomasclavelia spiroformis TaxID=29348 RepID=UPI003995FAAD